MDRCLHVHVVDSDYAGRAAIARELYGQAIHVEIYEDLEELISRAPAQGTVLVQADQPCLDETECLETVRERAGYMPVAFYSATPAPAKIVKAMQSGAVDYMQWPRASGELRGDVMRVAQAGEEKARVEAKRCSARRRVDALTKRERDVLLGLADGGSNKEIARALGISPRTVEIHRAGMLSRLEARSTAEAIRIGLHSGLLD